MAERGPSGTGGTRHWVERIKEAEREDAALFGIVLPGDSSLAVVLGAMEEAAYAGDPEFDSRCPCNALRLPSESTCHKMPTRRLI